MNAQRLFFRSLYIIFKVITIKMLIHIFFFSGLFDILPSQVESQILSDGNVKVFDLNKLVSNGINNLSIKYKKPLIFGLIGKPKIYATRYLKGMNFQTYYVLLFNNLKKSHFTNPPIFNFQFKNSLFFFILMKIRLKCCFFHLYENQTQILLSAWFGARTTPA